MVFIDMGLEAFPEIESFQKLPRQVIVKGGSSTFDERDGAKLKGIVINNIGHTICEVRVQMVILDGKGIPVQSAGILIEPSTLPQGGIGSFTFQVADYNRAISDYHLFANWKFDDRE
jgi:hypothetical protein